MAAEFSSCRKYRYRLTRIWDDSKPLALCIGLNPSTADHENNDPTIGILIRCLKEIGYGGFQMMNLYGIIEPKSGNLNNYPDKLGDNDKWLIETAKEVKDIIFCWGAFRGLEYRVKQVRAMFPEGQCFGKNLDGSPLHPMAIMWQGMLGTEIKLSPF